jgi:PAS domain S-box-containing protein
MDFRFANQLPEAILALSCEGDICCANTSFETTVAPFERVKGKLSLSFVGITTQLAPRFHCTFLISVHLLYVDLPFVEEFISGADQNRFLSAFYKAVNNGDTSYPVPKCNTLCFGKNDFPLYKLVDWIISGSMRESGCILVTGRVIDQSESNNTTESELIEFFENSPVALHWLNSRGVIVWANAAELRMLGYSAEQFLGHYLTEFCPEDEGLLQTILSHLRMGGSVSNETLRFRTKDGRTKCKLQLHTH